MIKILITIDIEGSLSQHSHVWQTQLIIIRCERQTVFLKSGRQGCLPSPFLFNTVLEVLDTTISKKVRGIQIIGREEVNCHDLQMTQYYIQIILKYHQETIRINEFSKVVGYKVNIQKSTALLNTVRKRKQK